MTLKELQPQLLALTPEEKSQAIQILVQSLSNTWQGIEKNPRVMGGDACNRSHNSSKRGGLMWHFSTPMSNSLELSSNYYAL